eukprot:3677719-Amphidinium_carterae.1
MVALFLVLNGNPPMTGGCAIVLEGICSRARVPKALLGRTQVRAKLKLDSNSRLYLQTNQSDSDILR